MSIQTLIPSLAFSSFTGLAILVWVRARNRHAGRMLSTYLALMAMWSFFSVLMHAEVMPEHAIWWNRGAIAVGAPYSLLYFDFLVSYLGRTGLRPWLTLGYVAVAPVTAYVMFGDVVRYAEVAGGEIHNEFGPGMAIAVLYSMGFMVLSAYVLIGHYRRTRDDDLRTRIFYLLAGFGIATLGIFTNFHPALVRYPVDQAGNLINAFLIAYVVLRHNLLETGVLIRKGALYAALSVIIGAFYLLSLVVTTLLLRQELGPVDIAAAVPLALLITLVFQPLRTRVQWWVDRMLLGEHYDQRMLLRESSRVVASSLELKAVCSQILDLVGRAMRADKLGLLVLDNEQSLYRPVVADEAYRGELQFSREHPAVRYLETTKTPLAKGDILSRPQFFSLWQTEREQIIRLDFELLVPLIAQGVLVGIMVLGLKRSEQKYTAEDVALLNIVGNQTAVAVDNARLYSETVTAYQRLQETQGKLVQLERLRALGEMAGGVAHTFNNVLAGILARAELLLEDVTDERLKKDLQVIERVTLDASQTVRRIQEFAKVRTDESFSPIDLRTLVDESLDLVHPKLQEKVAMGAEIQLVKRLGAQGWLEGDVVEIKEAICNILLNAVDAMPAGGMLTIESRDADQSVYLSVSDTGVGMPPEIQERIFEPFFSTKGPRGTGLGLSVAYGTLVRHKGDISVESTPGCGTTLVLRFPSHMRSPADSPEERPPVHDGHPLRVLVVDDDIDVAEGLGRIVEALGHEVRVAYGGAEALQIARQEHFDLVLTDLGMPDLNGRELAAELKKSNGNVRVVLVTGWGLQLDQSELAKEGIAGVITKPSRREDLQAVIARTLGTRETAEEDGA